MEHKTFEVIRKAGDVGDKNYEKVQEFIDNADDRLHQKKDIKMDFENNTPAAK